MARLPSNGRIQSRRVHLWPLGVALGVMLLSGVMGLENVLSRRTLQRRRQASLDRVAQIERVMSLSQDADLSILGFHLGHDPSRLEPLTRIQTAWPKIRERMREVGELQPSTRGQVEALLNLMDRHLASARSLAALPPENQQADGELFDVGLQLRAVADRLLAEEELREQASLADHVRRSEWFMAIGGVFLAASAASVALFVRAFSRAVRVRQKAEEALVQVRLEREHALDAASVGTFRRHLTSEEVTLDERGGRLFGYSGEVRVSYAELLARMVPEDRERVAQEQVSSEQIYSANFRIVPPGLPMRWIQARGRWSKGQKDEEPSLVGVVRDMTSEMERQRELETLRGLLPICAWCKRIRSDAGYWDQVETYFARRDQLGFTHSICPECKTQFDQEAKALRPDSEPT